MAARARVALSTDKGTVRSTGVQLVSNAGTRWIMRLTVLASLRLRVHIACINTGGVANGVDER